MKQLLFNKQVFEKLLIGLDKVADAVSGTLGPKGRNVMIDDSILPHITNDGSTIAGAISFVDKFENLGAWVVKNTSAQTNDDAGDGTTTTAVLLQEIIHKSLERPENPMEIKNSLQEACKKIIKKLEESSQLITIDDIKKVALISSENEEIANIVTEVLTKIGEKGVIVVEESKTFETSYEVQEGYEANVGFVSPYFANDLTGSKAVYESVPVLVASKKISTVLDIKPLFDQMDAVGKRDIVIVCEDIDPSILGLLVVNKAQGKLGALVIKSSGSVLEDIAATVGASIISDSTGFSFDKLDINVHLGKADKVICSEKKTLFVAKTEEGKKLATRLEAEAAICNNQYESEALLKRVAKLTGGIAVIKIGAATDLDRVYRKHKTDDTVAAVKAALEEGIVEGGGMALWRIAQSLEPKTVGEEILKKALVKPLKKIIENCGKDYTEIIRKMPEGMGYDAKNDTYVDMIKANIIDPLKVERVSLENAVSNAAVFITTHCAVTDIEEKAK